MKNIYILIPTDSYELNLFKSLVYIIQLLCVKKSSQKVLAFSFPQI
jgi:hypothetical protein